MVSHDSEATRSTSKFCTCGRERERERERVKQSAPSASHQENRGAGPGYPGISGIGPRARTRAPERSRDGCASARPPLSTPSSPSPHLVSGRDATDLPASAAAALVAGTPMDDRCAARGQAEPHVFAARPSLSRLPPGRNGARPPVQPVTAALVSGIAMGDCCAALPRLNLAPSPPVLPHPVPCPSLVATARGDPCTLRRGPRHR